MMLCPSTSPILLLSKIFFFFLSLQAAIFPRTCILVLITWLNGLRHQALRFKPAVGFPCTQGHSARSAGPRQTFKIYFSSHPKIAQTLALTVKTHRMRMTLTSLQVDSSHPNHSVGSATKALVMSGDPQRVGSAQDNAQVALFFYFPVAIS